MSIQSAIDELSNKLGTPKERAPFGQWVPYAYLVRGLVEKNHGVSTSVTHVLTSTGKEVNKRTFGSLRAAYYKIRETPWPEEGAE
jgi:hypothetical protein